MSGILCLHRDWRTSLARLVESAQSELMLAAPFITADGTELVQSKLSRSLMDAGRIELLTDLSPSHVSDGALDPEALSELTLVHSRCAIWHLPALHAKVYVADRRRAIVTSGNLTSGGLHRNIEYGVEIVDPGVARQIRSDLADLQAIGAVVPRSALVQYAEIARQVRDSHGRQRTCLDPALVKAYREAVRKAENQLMRLRLAVGPMHTVFARTITLVLARRGPLATPAIHEEIQRLHPDLCDDAIDRVIDGKRFGKKWKHAVRTAQQQLKKRDQIRYDGRLWHGTLSQHHG